jgi:hypothetical protein
MEFKATPAQLDATQLLFIAMIYNNETQAKFEQFETEVLASGTFHYSEDWYAKNWKKRGFDLPEDRIIRERKDSFMMDGISVVGTERYEGTDAQRFYRELRKKALAAGYIHGENSACIASSDVADLENKLIDITYDTHKILREDIPTMKLRKQLLEIILNFFGGLVKGRPFDDQARKFNNERLINPRMIKDNYSNSEASFREFIKLRKQFATIRFLTNQNWLHELRWFGNVESVIAYTDDCFIYKVKKGCTWEYRDQVTTSEYVILDANEKVIESNKLETIERILFQQFLNN